MLITFGLVALLKSPALSLNRVLHCKNGGSSLISALSGSPWDSVRSRSMGNSPRSARNASGNKLAASLNRVAGKQHGNLGVLESMSNSLLGLLAEAGKYGVVVAEPE